MQPQTSATYPTSLDNDKLQSFCISQSLPPHLYFVAIPQVVLGCSWPQHNNAKNNNRGGLMLGREIRHNPYHPYTPSTVAYINDSKFYVDADIKMDVIKNSFTYEKLPYDDTQPIRVLKLFPSTKFEAAIECEIMYTSLKGTNRVEYEALSYAWGDVNDPENRGEILLKDLSR
ncbi:hypothetical protein DL98DRAFT_523919 [Cadophora sp. DSE1049]|nr:hypothetical protein DL98DRAFT_523919 [Cadophora sp. DSE1049]